MAAFGASCATAAVGIQVVLLGQRFAGSTQGAGPVGGADPIVEPAERTSGRFAIPGFTRRVREHGAEKDGLYTCHERIAAYPSLEQPCCNSTYPPINATDDPLGYFLPFYPFVEPCQDPFWLLRCGGLAAGVAIFIGMIAWWTWYQCTRKYRAHAAWLVWKHTYTAENINECKLWCCGRGKDPIEECRLKLNKPHAKADGSVLSVDDQLEELKDCRDFTMAHFAGLGTCLKISLFVALLSQPAMLAYTWWNEADTRPHTHYAYVDNGKKSAFRHRWWLESLCTLWFIIPFIFILCWPKSTKRRLDVESNYLILCGPISIPKDIVTYFFSALLVEDPRGMEEEYNQKCKKGWAKENQKRDQEIEDINEVLGVDEEGHTIPIKQKGAGLASDDGKAWLAEVLRRIKKDKITLRTVTDMNEIAHPRFLQDLPMFIFLITLVDGTLWLISFASRHEEESVPIHASFFLSIGILLVIFNCGYSIFCLSKRLNVSRNLQTHEPAAVSLGAGGAAGRVASAARPKDKPSVGCCGGEFTFMEWANMIIVITGSWLGIVQGFSWIYYGLTVQPYETADYNIAMLVPTMYINTMLIHYCFDSDDHDGSDRAAIVQQVSAACFNILTTITFNYELDVDQGGFTYMAIKIQYLLTNMATATWVASYANEWDRLSQGVARDKYGRREPSREGQTEIDKEYMRTSEYSVIPCPENRDVPASPPARAGTACEPEEEQKEGAGGSGAKKRRPKSRSRSREAGRKKPTPRQRTPKGPSGRQPTPTNGNRGRSGATDGWKP